MPDATPRGVSARTKTPPPPPPPEQPAAPASTLADATAEGPLSAGELRQFLSIAGRLGLGASVSDQLAASQAGQSPGVRIGSPYRALTNLSMPRRGRKPDDPNDLVLAGETVWLTDEEAARFNRHNERDGRRIPVLQPLDEVEPNAGPPRIPPRALSGPIHRPVSPPKGDTGPRPDPPGSSTLQILERIPEMAEPAPGDEDQHEPPAEGPDALDIPPRGHGGS